MVIHGAADPLIRPAAARATAGAIQGSKLKIFEGMGHDLPRELWPQIVEAIDSNARRARAGAAAAA